MPSLCTNPSVEPVRFPMETDSWAAPGSFVGASYEWMSSSGELFGLRVARSLKLTPSVSVMSEERRGATPSGLDVGVSVPDAGLLDPEGLAQADVRDATVTLPPGVVLSPAAANGLVGCPLGARDGFEGIGFTGFRKFRADEAAPETATFTKSFRFVEEEDEGTVLKPSCPDALKLGTVEIETPLLREQADGVRVSCGPSAERRRGPEPVQ